MTERRAVLAWHEGWAGGKEQEGRITVDPRKLLGVIDMFTVSTVLRVSWVHNRYVHIY